MQVINKVVWRNARKMQRDIRHRVLGLPWMQAGPDDRFLFSYPRSGNTWLRHIVQHLVQGAAPSDHDTLDATFGGSASASGKKSWRERLTPEQNRRFVDQSGDLLSALGYPLD